VFRGFVVFVLVSSDSDFTELALRLREHGRPVYGFGRTHTPQPFIAACSGFTYLGRSTAPPPTATAD
jgi:uncharacterized LabA/DUF88 family protein